MQKCPQKEGTIDSDNRGRKVKNKKNGPVKITVMRELGIGGPEFV